MVMLRPLFYRLARSASGQPPVCLRRLAEDGWQLCLSDLLPVRLQLGVL